ncbi:Uncharacterised protein [Serratia rubidaea]|uniref:Uncharacterized protein n=1 Tax=Serratia rubidaea TaxID=61652 RepID=A0A3S5DEZ2_SERRU|nr:Uncharacterised protein [Serratia rubidaea]
MPPPVGAAPRRTLRKSWRATGCRWLASAIFAVGLVSASSSTSTPSANRPSYSPSRTLPIIKHALPFIIAPQYQNYNAPAVTACPAPVPAGATCRSSDSATPGARCPIAPQLLIAYSQPGHLLQPQPQTGLPKAHFIIDPDAQFIKGGSRRCALLPCSSNIWVCVGSTVHPGRSASRSPNSQALRHICRA